jgi:chromosome segregation and condensation protein ScpB
MTGTERVSADELALQLLSTRQSLDPEDAERLLARLKTKWLTEAIEVAATHSGCPCNTAETIAFKLRAAVKGGGQQ